MANNIVLKAIGLVRQPNFLDPQVTPPGSLLIASDIVIQRDNIIQSRRGYPLYGTAMGTSSDRADQLMTYKNRILRHFSNKLEWDTLENNVDGQAIFDQFAGAYLEALTGRRIRSIEQNGNLYFTSDSGIKKISARSASDFTTASGYITQAGGIKAIDLTSRLVITPGGQTGFLPQDSAVAYRSVWGSTDLNKNEILGAPSQRSVIYNPLQSLLLQDFDRLLVQLDNVSNNAADPSLISDGDYYSELALNSQAPALAIQTNLLALSEKLDDNILYADEISAPLQISGAYINDGIGTISFSSGNPSDYFISGSKIRLGGFTPDTGVLNQAQIISTLNASTSTTGDTTTGVAEETDFTTVADVAGSLNSTYFFLYSANDVNAYYVWLNVDNTGTDPNIAEKIGVRVNIASGATNNDVATAIRSALNGFGGDFTTSGATNHVIVTNSSVGATTNYSPGTTGFSSGTITDGIDANIITSVASTAGITVGMLISGTGIPTLTYVIAVGLSTITISQNATATNSGITLTFDAGINFNTTASGNVIFTAATINSNEYETIQDPLVPDISPTNDELVSLQTYLQAIITRLQSEPDTGTPPVISSASQSTFISPLDITTSANVLLDISIPREVTVNNFLQLYRSSIAQATGTQVLSEDIFPNDELKLVYEAFPTANDISNGFIEVTDITPPEFAGAFLYTNATTGEGILQSNDVPPYALDINRFKNYTFYANTKTRFSQLIDLLGVVNMITDYNNSITPKLTISNGVTTHTYSFVTGLQEISTITTVADVAGNLAGKYFDISSANDFDQFRFYYIVSGTGSAPASGGRTLVPIYINTGDSNTLVANKTAEVISSYNQQFNVGVVGHIITVTTVGFGPTTDLSAGTSGFAVAVTQQGRGENASTLQVLLSTNTSPAQAVDETARSLVHVINKQATEIINAFYLSDAQSVPGQMQFEAISLSQPDFYILANNSNTGSSFNPDISPSLVISNISVANPTVITTSTSHGLTNQDQVVICASNSTPSVDGLYTVTVLSPTTFSINVHVTIAGNTGALKPATSTLKADNLIKVNRIYFSKLLQPEAVPAENFLDVGAQDKAILRIFPLRDSLFVFKEDGLYRISGETAPFNLALFDISCILIAADSLDASNNLLYGWTTQGITSVSESGATNISRPIDQDIQKLASARYTNFRSATWGIGYESDNCYQVATVQNPDDIRAQIVYRYSTLTNTWTTWDKSVTCGVINPIDDKEYFGSGDENFLEKERKDFERTDFADQEHIENLNASSFAVKKIKLTDITIVSEGDVVTQEQYVTVYNYNNLLEKLDTDDTLSPHDYESTLAIQRGDNVRTAVDALLEKVANDPGRNAQPGALPSGDYTKYEAINGIFSITGISASDPTIITSTSHGLTTGRQITIVSSNSSPSIDGIYEVTVLSANTFSIPKSVTTAGTSASYSVNNNSFLDVQTSYNGLIVTLNADPAVTYGNYSEIENSTLQEAIVLTVDVLTKYITLNLELDFVVGPITIYNSIPTMVQYAPQDMQDPLSWKHFREAIMFFEDTVFTSASLFFSSDLLPAFNEVPFTGTSNGIFGFNPFGFNFFGGGGNSAPYRTYIPRDNQRCRYLNVKFEHNVAREKFSILGLVLVGENTQSSRAYR